MAEKRRRSSDIIVGFRGYVTLILKKKKIANLKTFADSRI